MRRRVSVPALLIAVVFVGFLAVIAARVWREGAMGCASAFERAAYYDAEELDRLGDVEPVSEEPVFTDAAWDEAFPDLYEAPNGETQPE